MDNRWINDEYQEIAQELIDERPELSDLRGADVQIILLSSEAEKKTGDRLIYGQCEKVPQKYKWGIPCDFTITIFDRNISDFSDEQLRILIFHELLHVGIDEDKLYVKKHDLEDFKAIINLYGTDWDRPGWRQLELDLDQ